MDNNLYNLIAILFVLGVAKYFYNKKNMSKTKTDLYNFVLAFFVYAGLRYTAPKYFADKVHDIREMISMSTFYAVAYVFLKNFAK